ncbi:hypothetical protein ANN_26840 [Periplaneta americana]|uniref:Uncharacterized protein n=1 Tax=Periplaneta americana TaxID=6978 RepID=A0ABQ8RZU8_PERAM|nr:hypothetical protein ANN_26840 [Periplaneta americana]
MSFNYLGAKITSDGCLKEEVRDQVNKAAAVSGYLNSYIWKNKYLRRETKIRIYKTVVRPIMTYAVETRSDTTKTKQMMNVTEMKVLRNITGKTKLDRIQNTGIRDICNIQPIEKWTARRRDEWNKHVERMPLSRLVRRVRDGVPRGRRSPGRPKKRWSDSLPVASTRISRLFLDFVESPTYHPRDLWLHHSKKNQERKATVQVCLYKRSTLFYPPGDSQLESTLPTPPATYLTQQGTLPSEWVNSSCGQETAKCLQGRTRDPLRSREENLSRRQYSFKYFLFIRSKRVQVCSKTLLQVYAISSKRIRILQAKMKNNEPLTDQRGKHMNRPHRTTNEIIDLIVQHIQSFPTQERHYSRKKKLYAVTFHQTFRTNRKTKKSAKVYVPFQWVEVIVAARSTNPFQVTYIHSEDFKNFDTLDKNVTQPKEFKITEAMWLKCSQDDPFSVYVRTSHGTLQSWVVYPFHKKQRGRNIIPVTIPPASLEPLYQGHLPIKKEKKRDLTYMCEFMTDIEHRKFYMDLPVSN